MSASVSLLAYSLIPTVAMVAAGITGAFRMPGERLRSGVLHFAAGVVFSVVAVELLPDLTRTHAIWETVLGFSLGTGVMLVIRSVVRKAAHPDEQGNVPSAGMLVATGVDILIDGLMIGIGFVAGAKEGVLLTIALTAEALSLGFATAASLRNRKVAPRKTVLLTSLLASGFVIGALAGAVPLRGISDHGLAIVLAFGCAALLFLVTEELLTEAHETEESPLLTAAFFAGFLLFLVLGMVS